MTEYHIRVQLVDGGEEQIELGRAGLHEFSLSIDAGSEEEALGEKGHKAIEEWCDKHRLWQSRYLFNLANRFTGHDLSRSRTSRRNTRSPRWRAPPAAR